MLHSNCPVSLNCCHPELTPKCQPTQRADCCPIPEDPPSYPPCEVLEEHEQDHHGHAFIARFGRVDLSVALHLYVHHLTTGNDGEL